jgi:exodeoxyribonuclease X
MDNPNLIFLDTETTGRGPDDRLCQLAYKFQGAEFESLFKPPLSISVEAMAVSHITNKMVENREAFIGSELHRHLEELLEQENIFVAHNADFDAEMLRREGLAPQKIIDTYKIAQYLDRDALVPRFGLQYLRYFFDLEIDDARAHDALGDVRVLEGLFDYLFSKMAGEFEDGQKAIEKMIEISSRPIFIKKFNFGKYKGTLVGEVAMNDPGYLRWLLDEKTKTRDGGGDDDANWIHTLKHYVGQ